MEKISNLAIKADVVKRYIQVPTLVAQSKIIKPSAKLVYGSLLSFIRKTGGGKCYAKKKTIARNTGLSEKTVELALNQLRDIDMITWTSSAGRSNHYYLKRLPIAIYGGYDKRVESIQHSTQPEIVETTPARNPGLDETKIEDIRILTNKYATVYKHRFGIASPPCSRKEQGQMNSIIKMCHGDVNKAMDLTDYIFRNWTALALYWKIDTEAPPTMSIILSFGKSQIPKVAKAYGWESKTKKQRARKDDEDRPSIPTATIKMEDDF